VATILARSAEHDLVRGDRVAAPTGDARDRRLERRVLEWLDLPAVVTDEVMMVALVMDRLEACDPVPEIDPLYEAELVHSLERPVHARDPDPRAARSQGVVDLLRRQAAVLLAEVFDHEAPCAAASPGCVAEPVESRVRPRHPDNDSRSQRHASVRPMKRTVLFSVLVLALAGCGGSDNSTSAETVVAAFYPLAWAAEQVGGASVDVEDLTPPGAEPHDIELTPRDIERVQSADLVLYLGSGFQPALEKAVAGRSGTSLDLLEGQHLVAGAGEEEGGLDPHVWLDPVRFADMVGAIGAALKRQPAAEALASKLHALDAEMKTGLAHCRRNEIVTSHAAFGYLAKRYGLHQIALTGLSPESEPSPRDLEGLVDEVEKSHATTVFFETLVSPKLAATVAREAGVKTAVLDPIEGLTPDEVQAGADYFSVMRANLAALRDALGCS
jgi:zinc transport system substrate-binding protein